MDLYHLLVDNEETHESIYDIPEKEEAKAPSIAMVVHDADEVVVEDKVCICCQLSRPPAVLMRFWFASLCHCSRTCC